MRENYKQAPVSALKSMAKEGNSEAVDELVDRLLHETDQADNAYGLFEEAQESLKKVNERNGVLFHAFMDLKLTLSSLRDRIDDQLAEADEIRQYVDNL